METVPTEGCSGDPSKWEGTCLPGAAGDDSPSSTAASAGLPGAPESPDLSTVQLALVTRQRSTVRLDTVLGAQVESLTASPHRAMASARAKRR